MCYKSHDKIRCRTLVHLRPSSSLSHSISFAHNHPQHLAGVHPVAVDWDHPRVRSVVEEKLLRSFIIWEEAGFKGSSEGVEFDHSLPPVIDGIGETTVICVNIVLFDRAGRLRVRIRIF
jgi:hypothetical protein